MSNYTKTTNFTAKDALAPGNPSKKILGADFDTEFDAIATAVGTKADTASPTLTGTPAAPTAAVDTNTTQLATTAFVIGQGYLKAATAASTYAPLASPALTGTPTAPTAAAATNSTQIATTAFVATAIANLINSAPGALDTLAELATALGSDPNFATTITNALALKAPLASPTLTGVPAAPTAAADTNTTQLATTAFVIGQGYLKSATAASTYAALASGPTFTGLVYGRGGGEGLGQITVSTSAPSGGAEGDIWLQY